MNAQRTRRLSHRAAVPGLAAVCGDRIARLPLLRDVGGCGRDPPETGCPAGYLTLSASWLESQGPYQLPARRDDPANGGNGDQLVCGKPINDPRTAKLCGTPCDVPVRYLFADDNLTPRH